MGGGGLGNGKGGRGRRGRLVVEQDLVHPPQALAGRHPSTLHFLSASPSWGKWLARSRRTDSPTRMAMGFIETMANRRDLKGEGMRWDGRCAAPKGLHRLCRQNGGKQETDPLPPAGGGSLGAAVRDGGGGLGATPRARERGLAKWEGVAAWLGETMSLDSLQTRQLDPTCCLPYQPCRRPVGPRGYVAIAPSQPNPTGNWNQPATTNQSKSES